ncbi:MAG TPA: AgmX/PglI C-terminal domain-containing protein [Polyangiaceae bacterium]
MLRRALLVVCIAGMLGCGAAEPRTSATLPPPPVIAEPRNSPKTSYGVDPPIPRDRDDSGDADGGSPGARACGESSGMQGFSAPRNAARACYLRSLSSDPNRGSGKVTFRVVLGRNGDPTSVTVASSTLNDAALEACIAGVLRSGHYPCVTGEVTVPFVFAPAP